MSAVDRFAMGKIDKSAAEDVLERASLSELNRALAGYWLSLWRNDALPRYEDFDPGQVAALRPNLMTFDVVPEQRITVRDAGADLCRILGRPLQGLDWIAWAAVRNRRLRGRNFTAVAGGAMMLDHRRLSMTGRGPLYNEELVLPFAPDAVGVSPVVAHVDWREAAPFRFGGIREIEILSRDHRVLSFRRRRRGRL